MFFFFLRALQAPSSTSPGQGTEQLSARGQRAARRQQCVNSSPYSGQGSARSSNHSQQQLNSPLQHTQTPSRLPSVTCCSLHPFLQLQKGEKKKNQSGGFSWIKRTKSRAVTAGVVFPKHHECLDHTRHFQRGMGVRTSQIAMGDSRGAHLSRRTGFPTSRQGCQAHEGRRLEGRRDGF